MYGRNTTLTYSQLRNSSKRSATLKPCWHSQRNTQKSGYQGYIFNDDRRRSNHRGKEPAIGSEAALVREPSQVTNQAASECAANNSSPCANRSNPIVFLPRASMDALANGG